MPRPSNEPRTGSPAASPAESPPVALSRTELLGFGVHPGSLDDYLAFLATRSTTR